MLKPPAATMPGVSDTLDFVKNLWGSMNIPGMSVPGISTPPLTTDELDKRITDLKAVESWLNMNVTMLRGTIQTLEVQRATLATLKSMGDSMTEAMRQSGMSTEGMAAMPFASFFGQPAQGAAPSPGAASAGGGGSAQPGTAAPAGKDGASAAAGAGAMPAAMAWWNLLQEQFTQAVTAAMTPKPADGAGNQAAEPSQPAPPSQEAQGSADAPRAGNGKARAGKPKPDKA